MKCVLASFALAGCLFAEVSFNAERKLFFLNTASSTYVLGINERNELQTVYWGAPIARQGDFTAAHSTPDRSSFDPSATRTNEEYPGWGGTRFSEPALKLTRADGNRDLVLVYKDHSIIGDTLMVRLKDIQDNITVSLTYRLYSGVIEKTAKIENGTNQDLTLDSALSGTWSMPHGEGYRLTYSIGRWASEWQLQQEPIHTGTKVLESRRGITSHQNNPWFMIDDGAAGEEQGGVWFGALAWSGNWRLTVEQTPYQELRITGGLNPFDFAAVLKPGESLSTPAFYGGFSAQGFGGASRTLHRFERESIFPGGLQSRLRPILYNSWEATTFNVDEPGQKALAAKAAALGVELFVIDDGWFGARNNDHAGLGDWFVNKKKFPNDLQPLIAEVNRLGMDFGLWVEPEMVNRDSDLYRAHPDWVIHFPGRPRSELRNQLVLNLALPEVKSYVFEVLDRLASTYKIRYFKWDMNRALSEPGWTGAANPKSLWLDYVSAYYDILDKLSAKHPALEIEGCSGGGGRIDLGVLKRVNEVWPSDNTEAFDRLKIQEGFTYAYAPRVMSAWVTDVPNTNGRSVPLQFRFLAAMQGLLGIGANLNKWSDADLAFAKKMIELDKQIRPVVQTGALYRLMSPRFGDLTASEYVAEDGQTAVLFAFLHSQQFGLPVPTIHLRGLDPKAVYTLQFLDGRTAESSGAYLMNRGVDLNLRGDYDSSLIVLSMKR